SGFQLLADEFFVGGGLFQFSTFAADLCSSERLAFGHHIENTISIYWSKGAPIGHFGDITLDGEQAKAGIKRDLVKQQRLLAALFMVIQRFIVLDRIVLIEELWQDYGQVNDLSGCIRHGERYDRGIRPLRYLGGGSS